MADTPLMKQYHDMKQQYADMVLFFRLGDFYEMFDEDAIEVSSLLNLTLTHKSDNPMCGIPFHAAKNYIKRLLDAGKKIAICEQLELSDSAKSLAKREVVRIITPATVVDEDFLNEYESSYILCIFQHSAAYCDVTTGEFHLRSLAKNERIENVRTLLEQISPKEIIVCEDEYYLDNDFKSTVDNFPAMITKLAPWYFSLKNSYKTMCSTASVNSLAAFGLDDQNKLICPAGALLKYIIETSKSTVSHLTDYIVDSDGKFLQMDESTRRNLELFSNLYDGSSRYSLCDTINRCKTASGTRLLKNWISFPLNNLDEIKERQNWVDYFFNNVSERERIKSYITSAMDVNRLTTRVLLKKAVPHDLVSVKQSICTFFSIISENLDKYHLLFEPVLNSESMDRLSSLMDLIDQSIEEEFLGQFNEGEVIKTGFDQQLDSFRKLKSESDAVLKDYLEEEKKNTGLTILKLGYNRVYGYYLEVSNGQLDRTPDYFIRRQTLVNGERFTTAKLQEFERSISQATILAEEREKEIYNTILNSVSKEIPLLNAVGHFLNYLDVYQGLATLASDSNYIRPEMNDSELITIVNGRHPVVEKQLGPGKFTANNLNTDIKFSLITGPNMAGKSTYLRQNALIILLAHIGSFVPADKAGIGLVDKIFCRVGAMDNLARGESTFLVEMQETAFILRNCTSKSFVIVDEIGRGTSTQDGMSLAYSIMKNLIEKNVKTLFATHYHELTMMNNEGLRLLTLQVEENNNDVIFIRKVIDGVANSSYGIHVAKLAGIPTSVIKEAKSFQNKHFADYSLSQNNLFTSNDEISNIIPDDYDKLKRLSEQLKSINIDECTPMQAMIILSKIKEDNESI